MKQDIKKKVKHRLAIIEGQVRGLQKMVENEEYCVDIITQSSAVREALSAMESRILENHLLTHVKEQMNRGQTHIAVNEMLKVYKLNNKVK